MPEAEAVEVSHVDLNEMQNRLATKETTLINNLTQHLKTMFSDSLPPDLIVQPTEQVDSIEVVVDNESPIVLQFFRDRILNSEGKIHDKLKDNLQLCILPLCTSGPLASETLDELEEKIIGLAGDTRALWKAFEDLGADFWLQDSLREANKLLDIG